VEIGGITSIAQDVQNDYVLESQRRYKDRIFGYVFGNPRDKNAVETVRRYLGEGLKGLKLHPRFHGYALHNVDMVGPLIEVCEEYGVPVFGHGSAEEFNTPFQFEEIARAFPKVPIIIGHMGSHNMVDMAIKAAKRNANVYLDTSYSMLDAVVTAIRSGVSTDRMLMSTDWPGSDFGLEQLKIDLATENDPEARRKIKGENYAKLTGMKI
jgi:predicted TIM-barrel fold metal-dependent hydrolase